MISTKSGNVNRSVILHTPTALILDDADIQLLQPLIIQLKPLFRLNPGLEENAVYTQCVLTHSVYFTELKRNPRI